MKTVIAPFVLCLCAALAPAATTTTQSAASGTRYASRHLRIVSQDMKPTKEDIEQFIVSHRPALASQIVHRSADNIDDWFKAQESAFSSGGGGFTAEFDLAVALSDDDKTPPAAKELLDAMVKSIDQFLRDGFDRQAKEQIEPLDRASDEARVQVDQAERRARELRAKMRELAGRGDISGKTITEAITRLEEEKQKLELDTMAKTARREAMEQEIAEQGKRMAQKIDSDAIAEELAKVVDARQSQLERVKKMADQGQASQAEAAEAVGRVAEARAKLLERKRDAAAEAGGDALAALNRELLTLSIDLRELKARLVFVEKRLPGLRDAMDQLDAWERAESDLQSARGELNEANSELRRVRRNLYAAKPPQVVVTQSEDRAERPKNAPLFPSPPGLFQDSPQPHAR